MYRMHNKCDSSRQIWIEWILTLLFDLSDLLHCFFEDGTFIRLDVEIIHVIDVGEDQFCQLLNVLVLLLPIPPLSAPLRAGRQVGNKDNVKIYTKNLFLKCNG